MWGVISGAPWFLKLKTFFFYSCRDKGRVTGSRSTSEARTDLKLNYQYNSRASESDKIRFFDKKSKVCVYKEMQFG